MIQSNHHDSSHLHVTGKAVFIDDIPNLPGLLYGKVYYSPHSHANIKSYSLIEARNIEGVYAILSYEDIPGHNKIGPIVQDEYILAEDKVEFIGQAIFLIAAESIEIANKASSLIDIEYEELAPVIYLEEAIEKGKLLFPERNIIEGNPDLALSKSKHNISGELYTGAQEHWYLETQISIAIPGEGAEIKIHSSSQHPSEVQDVVSEVLGIPANNIEVEVKRMGGAFGGKETQAGLIAAWASLLALKTQRPVKLKLSRDDDQKITGKRHPFMIKYDVGFDESGQISALKVVLNSNGGAANDLSKAIMERAMFHAENSYYIPNIHISGRIWKTNTPPNTAFRGFGAPQAIAGIENVIDRISRFLKIDQAEIRSRNFYGLTDRNTAPYGQVIENNHLNIIFDQLIKSSDYYYRRDQVNIFNKENTYYKRGLAISPVKFGISFTTSFLNQAGALVHIYKDGSILVNHGGTEMGQGLHTKIRRIAALELGVNVDRVIVSATNTSKVPNTSATAASSGTDLNGMAVKNAIRNIKSRLLKYASEYLGNKEGVKYSVNDIEINDDRVVLIKNSDIYISFEELVDKAYHERISLSSTGFYKTPGIIYNPEIGKGTPFYYYAFGMAVSEVGIDTLTGSHKIIRTDILHDAGNSINTDIDKGQIAGAFVQGLGWCTTEECKWDVKGNLLNYSPDTYKVPTINDIPQYFRIELLEGYPNENTIRRSKAIGEPPFMHGISVWLAIKDAISAVGDHKIDPQINIPATNEKIVLATHTVTQSHGV